MKGMFTPLSLLVIACSAASLCQSAADNWPGFRGASGPGIARAESEAPLRWSKEQGVRWRAPLPAPGNGSPVVSGGKVFLCGAEDAKGTRRSLYCYDVASGDRDWVKTVAFDKAMPTHKTNPHCSTTPAAAGGKVVVWHASAGLYCYDFYGVQEWHHDLGDFRHMWGHGTSPVIYRGVVYLHSGPGEKIIIAAVDLRSGQLLWQGEETPEGGNAERTPENHYRGSWATPIVAMVGDQPQLICALPTRVHGYDLASGHLIWRCGGLKGPRGELVYSSPIMAGDSCVVIGGYQGPSIGFTAGVGKPEPTWRVEKNPQSIGTGIFHEGFLYVPDAGPPGIRCIEAATGEQKWHDRADGKNFWGSIVSAGGRAYVTDQSGTTHVFSPSPEGFRPLAANALGEPCNTTPAIAAGEIFIRTDAALYCIDGK